MIGAARYKEDVRKAIEAKRAAEAREKAALDKVERLRAELNAEKDKGPSVQTVIRRVEVPVPVEKIVEVPVEVRVPVEVPVEVVKEVVKVAAPASVASGMSGTNAQKIAALEGIIGTLQERLKLAGLEWEI